jgi:hypothetical protein
MADSSDIHGLQVIKRDLAGWNTLTEVLHSHIVISRERPAIGLRSRRKTDLFLIRSFRPHRLPATTLVELTR